MVRSRATFGEDIKRLNGAEYDFQSKLTADVKPYKTYLRMFHRGMIAEIGNFTKRSQHMNTTRQGLLETPVPPAQQAHYSQVSVEDIAKQMLASGYDPSINRAQAIANMQKVNIPQSVINHALEIADRQAAESKKAATATVPVTTVPPSGQAMQRMQPMNQGQQHKQPAFR